MKSKLVLTSAIILSLAGCTADSSQTIMLEGKDSQSSPISKPSAPISMVYKVLTENPKAGDEIEIQVEFSSSISSTVSSKMKTSKDLDWLNTKSEWNSTLNKSGLRSDIPMLKVSAPKDGVYYVNLMASVIDESGKVLYKPFTIPVTVGNGTVILESPGEIVLDEKGQKVIIQNVDSNN